MLRAPVEDVDEELEPPLDMLDREDRFRRRVWTGRF